MADALLPMKLFKNPPKYPLWSPLSRRLHHILLLMLGFCACTFMRINIAITMTCMVNSTAVALLEATQTEPLVLPSLPSTSSASSPPSYASSTSSTPSLSSSSFLLHSLPTSSEASVNSTSEGTCRRTETGKSVVIDYGGSLVWSHNVQNILFSANYWGGMLVVMPSMFLIQKYSPRVLLLLAVSLYVLSSFSLPLVALHLPYHFTFISRFIMGLGDGLINPASNAVIANWFPVSERSTALALFTTGNQLAGALGNPVAAALCRSVWGWPSVFYLAAAVGGAWSVAWALTSSDHPTECGTISHGEKIYLEANCLRRSNKSKSATSVPYARIFTSLPFLAVLICQIQVNLGITLFQVYLPSFFKDVLYLGVMSNGIFTSIPNVVNFVCKIGWSLLMDRLKERKTLSATAAVRLSQSIASFGSGLCLVGLAFFVDCSTPFLALALLCVNFGCMGTFTSGVYTSLLSLAPRFTGTLSSVALTAAIFARLATPTIVGFIKQTGSVSEWRILFLSTAVFSVIAGVIFLIFGSGDVQDWGRDKADSFRLSRTDLAAPPKLKLSILNLAEDEDDGETSLDRVVSIQRTRTESVCL